MPGGAGGEPLVQWGGRWPWAGSCFFIALEEPQENPSENNKINNIFLKILHFSSQEQFVPQHWAPSHRADTGDRV